MRSEFWWGNLVEKGHLEDQERDVSIELLFREIDCEDWRWTELACDLFHWEVELSEC
jgi:hypothetical protein